MEYWGTESSDLINQLHLNIPDWANIYGLGGDDVIHVYIGNAFGGPGDDLLIGYSPWSSAVYWDAPGGIFIDLPHNEVQDGYGSVDTIQNINSFSGSGNGDVFIGNSGNNVFWAFSSYDVMDGNDGIDTAVIVIEDSNSTPEFTKTESGWLVRYVDEAGLSKLLELTSVELLSVWTGEDSIDWDLISDEPYVIPEAGTVFQPVPYAYERDLWQITNWGIERLTFTEDLGAWYYPTPSDYNGPNNVFPIMGDATNGDFNGDGYQDILICWGIQPHVIPRETKSFSTLLLGSDDGLVKAEDGTIPSSTQRNTLYRALTANLNGDGVDDFVVGAFYDPAYADSNQAEIIFQSAPALAVLGSSHSVLIDISDHLEGQTLTEGDTRGVFDHATAVGDLNKDGIDDIFSGDTLWVSDGTGQWLDMTDKVSGLLPQHLTPTPMSLAIGDLNDDGINDILALYPDFVEDRVILFGKDPDNLEFSRMSLPDGYYGDNTKDNYTMIADVNYDGLNDVVVAETRALPYYEGSALQILIQTSPGVFVDETSERVDNEPRDDVHGEGQLNYMDANGDGFSDIIHTNNGNGLSLFLNDGSGHFTYFDSTYFDSLVTMELDGYQHLYPDEDEISTSKAFPIDANHDGILDWVVQVIKPGVTSDPFEDIEVALYVLQSTGLEFGRNEDEVLIGSPFDDLIYGLAGNDTFICSDGNDQLIGGEGLDSCVYDGRISSFSIQNNEDSFSIISLSDNSTDTLKGVERLHFENSSLALDLDTYAGIAAKVLGVTFGPDSIGNKEYVGIGLSLLEDGMSYEELASLAIGAAGAGSNKEVVSTLWENLFDSAPSTQEAAPYVAMLDDGRLTKGELTVLAADLDINQDNIDMIGLMQSGIEYIPYA